MTRRLLEVNGLAIEFDTPKGRLRVVDGVSFHLDEGEVLGILGESGSGKTMSTLAVLGLIGAEPGVVAGQILVDRGSGPIDLLAELPTVLAQRRDGAVRKQSRRWARLVQRRMRPYWGEVMTAVFQNPRHSLDPLMTIGAQVEESVRLAEPERSAASVRTRAIEWLDRVQMHLPERVYTSYAHELSGGMCQRAMIAVALARAPQLLIADEPTTGLDTTVRAEIVALFRELLADRRRSMLYISHDIREVLYLADRIIVMRQGSILETVSVADIKAARGTRHPYTASLLAAADLAFGGVA